MKWEHIQKPKEQVEHFTFESKRIAITIGASNAASMQELFVMLDTVRSLVSIGVKLDGIQTFKHNESGTKIWIHDSASKEYVESVRNKITADELLDVSYTTILLPEEY